MSGPGALRAILQAARQHGIRRPREAFLATQSPAWQKAFGQSVVKEPQWHYGSFDVGKGNARPNGPMHFGTYKASQDREHNVAFERLEREIRDDLMAEGFEPGPELDAQARREMSAQIENSGIPEYLFDNPEDVKRASYFLDIRNPMRVEDAQAVTERWAELEDLARKQGHDALVYRNAVEDRGRDSYVPLNDRPQVKAVTAREFDMDDPDVHKAGGGLVKGLKAARKGLSAADPEALTPAARLRAADAQWSRSPSIIKAPGGNWLDGSVENAVAPLKRAVREPLGEFVSPAARGVLGGLGVDPDALQRGNQAFNADIERDVALNRWIDKKLVGYIKNDMATERDPVRALAERGVTHAELPPSTGKIIDPAQKFLAKSRLAQDWEGASDVWAIPYAARKFLQSREKYGTTTVDHNPWLATVDPDTPVYGTQIINRHSDLGFDHLIDVLREQLTTGVLTPQQLDKVTMANAVERAHAYNLEREAARKAAQLADLEAMTPYKQYDEGWRWVQLDKPGQFAAESDAMGHSVRGYEPPRGHADWDKVSGNAGSLSYGHGGWDAIKSGRAKIYSLKGPDGKSYATVEAAHAETLPLEWFFAQPKELQAKVKEDLDYNPYRDGDHLKLVNWAQANPAYQEHEKANTHITQIKGPGNRAPDKAALPYLQDFVRSGKWSDVRDLSNAWFVPIAPDSDLALHLKRSGREVPRFITQDELTEFVRELSALREVPQ